MTQGNLLSDIQRETPKPHKRVRQTSVKAYELGRESFTGRKANVLRWLAAYWNRYNESPTSGELTEWVVMRSTEQVHTGCFECMMLYVRRGLNDLERASRKVQSVVEVVKGASRPCAVTLNECETWRIIERGTR